MKNVHGDVRSLPPSKRDELERLSQKRTHPQDIIDDELLEAVSSLVVDIERAVAVLIGRDGRITHVVLGSKDRVYLPDLGRFRLDGARLRRLRLVVVLPKKAGGKGGRDGKAPEPEISFDLLTDLEKLRLDSLLVAEVRADGSIPGVAFANLRPSEQASIGKKKIGHAKTQIEIEHAASVGKLGVDFTSFISELETQFRGVRSEGFDTSADHAVLVGAYTGRANDAEASMEELHELADTAGIDVVDTFIQRRRKLDPRTVIGKGKIEELVLHCLDLGADLVIFDRELSPSQLRSITKLTELRVIDRSMLILDIFAQRATTSDGRVQVELAQLKYSLPRLTESDSGLSRLTGGIGGRGPGETKLEISRRRARDRIADLEKKIDTLSNQRNLRRERRQNRGVPVVAIVGYTNAGKSTLLNALTKGDVFVENKLFATLDTATRRMRFPNEQEVVFVDTVGFIRELPEELVNAFRATLEEVGEADLLLHVVDASNPDLEHQIEVVDETLASLGFSDKPRLLIFNKSDKLTQFELSTLLNRFDALAVSAVQRDNLNLLVEQVQEQLNETFKGQDPGGFLDLKQDWSKIDAGEGE